MKRRVRLIAVAVALLIPGVALARFLGSGFDVAERLSLQRLPRTVGAWSVDHERALSPLEEQLLKPDDYVGRLYAAAGRSPIWLYVALYAEQTSYGRGAHDPAVCYPAQGWEVLATRSVEVAVPDGERLIATLFLAHQGQVEQRVLYWFQPAARWPRHQLREQLTRVWDGLAGHPQYAFVRLAATVVPGVDAERDLLEFAREIAWPVRSALSPEEAGQTGGIAGAGPVGSGPKGSR